jgi:glycosyltransferase involved in cell wall biosynthesis
MNQYTKSAIHPGTVFIQATNISQGGGRSLLDALMSALPFNYSVIAQLDTRMPLINSSADLTIRWVKPTLLGRLCAEWWLVKNVNHNDLVLCFGSLPPLFKLKGKSVVYVQNRFLVEEISLAGIPLKVKLRLAFERRWLRWRAANADEFIVQTPTMKTLISQSGYLNGKAVHVRPFVAETHGYQRAFCANKNYCNRDYDFIYVASGESHKNHRQLIEAWCLLAEQSLYPSLCLTLCHDTSKELCAWIDDKKDKYHLKITNVGNISHLQALKLYNHACALIYTSSLESFGLPLIEATEAGLPILASELDYVRDIIDPVETFDSYSPLSIARAVKRYLGVKEAKLELTDASSFLEFLMKDFIITTNQF